MEIERYLSGWRARAQAAAVRARDAEALARRAADECVRLLAAQGATGVWLIGSLARGTFEPGSDLDLMVAGLGQEQLRRAEAELSARLSISVDLVCAEQLDAGWRAYHERHGERRHG